MGGKERLTEAYEKIAELEAEIVALKEHNKNLLSLCEQTVHRKDVEIAELESRLDTCNKSAVKLQGMIVDERKDTEKRISNLQLEMAVDKSKLLNNIRWLNEGRILMNDVARELEQELEDNANLFLDMAPDIIREKIEKLRKGNGMQ